MDDIFVRYQQMPCTVPAVTVLDDNGDYNIYINPILSIDGQRAALRHELYHVRHNHFYDNIFPLNIDELYATEAEDYLKRG